MAVTILGNKKLQVELIADESTKTQLDELNVKYDDLDSRVDTILTTPTESVSAEEIIDARQGEASLGANITKVKSELAQRANFYDYEIQNKTRKTEALFTIWDDDSTKEIWDVLRPLQQQYNIPMSTAILTNWIDGNLGLTKSQLLQLIDEGWEATFHGDFQHQLDEMTYEEQYNHFEEVMETLESWGIKGVSIIAYPFSRRNNDTVLAGRKFFRAGRSTDYGINRPPFQTWDLVEINGEGKQHTLESLKKDIDDISENGGWGIYGTHANLMDELSVSTLESVIQYVQSKGNIEFVTANEALNRMGNIIDVGRYLERDKTIPHHVVGADGASSSHTNPNLFVEHPKGSINQSDLPNTFELGKIHFSLVQSNNGFPEVGYLVTNNLREKHAFQSFTSVTGRVRQRFESSGAWSDWQENDINIYLTADSVSAQTPITDFKPRKITLCTVTSHEGLPFSSAGLLMTNTLVNPTSHASNYQEFHNRSTSESYMGIVYRRYWLNNEWSNWQRISPTFIGTNYLLRSIPTERMALGEMYFSTTLNKPIWRNANNDGWVDSNGDSVTV